MKWRPIDSAPRDGTLLLLFGQWAGEISGIGPHNIYDIGFYGPNGDFDGFDWTLATGDAYACWMKPTHWMELPDPPKD